jgi:TetR/AcrR family transcriptional regulator, transcriptional repressor of bet genes
MPLSPPRSAGRTPRLRRIDSEDARRRQLIEATVGAIGELGFNATTIAEIARRAQVSTGLVSFYFGDKDGLLEATLRHLARQLSMSVAGRLRGAATPRERVQAVIDANLEAGQFERQIGMVWLAFWGQVPHSPRFARVQRAYQRRIASNLAHALQPAMGRERALAVAESTAAMIDGLWLRATLARDPDGSNARRVAAAYVDLQFGLNPSTQGSFER